MLIIDKHLLIFLTRSYNMSYYVLLLLKLKMSRFAQLICQVVRIPSISQVLLTINAIHVMFRYHAMYKWLHKKRLHSYNLKKKNQDREYVQYCVKVIKEKK